MSGKYWLLAMLYFDHSASSPPYDDVVDTVAEVMRRFYGNPSSLHGIGADAEKLLKQAGEVMAQQWQVEPDNVIFTSGGTESNNMAIFGAVESFSNRGRHLIASRIEHASVYECFRRLERIGCEVTYLNADATGAVRLEELASAIRDDTILVSVMHVNNETGRIQPIERIGALLAERPRILFHVDAVQAAGKLPLRPREANIDLMSISAHKFHGPKGVGALYRRPGLQLSPIIYGGGQQFGLRSGTENVPLIVGMAKAFRIGMERMAFHTERMYRLRSLLIDKLAGGKRIVITGTNDGSGMAPHIVHFRIPGIKAEVFVHALERLGFCVSSQSACSSGAEKPSRVLKAMGLPDEEAVSGIRVSLSHDHTEQDVVRLSEAVLQTSEQLGLWMG